MTKCINRGFQNDGHCQCRQPHFRSTLCWAAVLWPTCFTRTAYSHSLKTNGPAITRVIGTYHKYSLKENWTMNTAVNEMSDFINIFQVTFEEKTPNFKTSYLSFYCKFKVIPNAGLKSKICSVRLQNFIFVQWELAQDKSMKQNDPFRDSKKKSAVECVPARGDKSSIKFGLLPWKGNKSKRHSS